MQQDASLASRTALHFHNLLVIRLLIGVSSYERRDQGLACFGSAAETLSLRQRCVVSRYALEPRRGEVVERTEEVAAGICSGEFVKASGLRFGRGQQKGVGSTPCLMQIVDLAFAV